MTPVVQLVTRGHLGGTHIHPSTANRWLASVFLQQSVGVANYKVRRDLMADCVRVLAACLNLRLVCLMEGLVSIGREANKLLVRTFELPCDEHLRMVLCQVPITQPSPSMADFVAWSLLYS